MKTTVKSVAFLTIFLVVGIFFGTNQVLAVTYNPSGWVANEHVYIKLISKTSKDIIPADKMKVLEPVLGQINKHNGVDLCVFVILDDGKGEKLPYAQILKDVWERDLGSVKGTNKVVLIFYLKSVVEGEGNMKVVTKQNGWSVLFDPDHVVFAPVDFKRQLDIEWKGLSLNPSLNSPLNQVGAMVNSWYKVFHPKTKDFVSVQ